MGLFCDFTDICIYIHIYIYIDTYIYECVDSLSSFADI